MSDYSLYSQINDLVIMDVIEKGGRCYYELSCSYGHKYSVRKDSLRGDRFCRECKEVQKKQARVCKKDKTNIIGMTKGQLKLLSIHPNKPYERVMAEVSCSCGNVQGMLLHNFLRESQNYSCGHCEPYYKIRDDVVSIFLQLKEEVYEFIADKEVLPFLRENKWTIHKDCRNFYVRGSSGGRVFLHRLLTSCPDDKFVDHINGNGLDNRRCNLRIVDKVGNSRNTKLNVRNTSGKSGVAYREDTGKWRAFIGAEGKILCLGSYDTKGAAIAARELAEIHLGYHHNHGRDQKRVLGEDI